MTSLADMRQQYNKDSLLEENVCANPIEQFAHWFDDAVKGGGLEPNAMTVATVNERNEPEARIILLKSFDENGFVFFTNYESDKGLALAHNPNVCLLFFWMNQERQVRINGVASKISDEESTAYFNSRPVGSRIGAWVSQQSRPVTHQVLEQRVAEFTQKFGDNVPKPPYWGGYRVVPSRIEFWQGRPSRLHDRLVFTKQAQGWDMGRIAP